MAIGDTMKKLISLILILLSPLTLMAGPGMHGVGMGSGTDGWRTLGKSGTWTDGGAN